MTTGKRTLMLAVLLAAGSIGSPAAGPDSPAAQLEQINAVLSWQREDPARYAGQIEKILRPWARQDPAAALEFTLRPLEDDNIHAIFLESAGGILAGWTERDPVAARLFFEGLKSETAANLLAPHLMQSYASLAPESALEWVHTGLSGRPPHLRDALAKSVVAVYDRLGRREQVVRWLTLPDVAASGPGQSAAADLARYLARSAPEKAVSFAKGMPMGSAARAAAIQAAFRQWASGDSAACAAWIVKQRGLSPGPDADAEQAGYALGLSASQPEQALKEVALIADAALRSAVVQQLHPQSLTANPAAK